MFASLFASQKENNSILSENDNQIDVLLDKINLLEEKLAQKEQVIQKLRNVDLNNISPKQAFDFLWDILNSHSTNLL